MSDTFNVALPDLLAMGSVLHNRSEEIDIEYKKYYNTAVKSLSNVPHASNKLLEEKLPQYRSRSRAIVNNLTSQGHLLGTTVQQYRAQDSA